MSTGTRVPIAKALQIADALYARWGMTPEICPIVGSVRRGKADVGDLEFLAPACPPEADWLCSRIQETMAGDGLFAGVQGLGERVIGSVVSGLKPGFLAARVVVKPWDDIELPVQVFRYTPENFGWAMVMYTGPEAFGKWFLARWMRHWNIPPGGHALVKNHLRNAAGEIVAVDSERAAFSLCGLGQPIEPGNREAYVQHLRARQVRR